MNKSHYAMNYCFEDADWAKFIVSLKAKRLDYKDFTKVTINHFHTDTVNKMIKAYNEK